jgi:hypothetical protein
MPPRLGPVLAKLVWAEEHLRRLNTNILTYLDVCQKIVDLIAVVSQATVLGVVTLWIATRQSRVSLLATN